MISMKNRPFPFLPLLFDLNLWLRIPFIKATEDCERQLMSLAEGGIQNKKVPFAAARRKSLPLFALLI